MFGRANATVRFHEFMLSDAQPPFVKMNYLSPSKIVESPEKGV